MKDAGNCLHCHRTSCQDMVSHGYSPIHPLPAEPKNPCQERKVFGMTKAAKVNYHFLLLQGTITLCVGIALWSLESLMTRPEIETAGYIAAVFLTIMCLIGQTLIAWDKLFARAARSRRKLNIYFLAGLFSVVCWMDFWLYRSTPLGLLVLFAGLYGLFWSLLYIGLTLSASASPGKIALLCFLAAITFAIGVILSIQADIDRISAVTAVACYLTWIGIQTLFTAPGLFCNWRNRAA